MENSEAQGFGIAARYSRMSRGASIRKYLVSTLLSGVLVVATIYLAMVLLLRALDSLMGVMKPVAELLPLPEWMPTGELLSLFVLLLVCFVFGILIGTSIGQSVRQSFEQFLLNKLPAYSTIRSFTERVLGESEDKKWKPALAEIEEALVPAFIVEELDDGLVTIFVPAVPTP